MRLVKLRVRAHGKKKDDRVAYIPKVQAQVAAGADRPYAREFAFEFVEAEGAGVGFLDE